MGALSIVAVAESSATVNLTSLAFDDWAHWGYGGDASLTPPQRKSGGGSTISATMFPSSPWTDAFSDSPRGISYTDGTPTGTVTSSAVGIYENTNLYGTSDTGGGYTITVPASLDTRQVTIWTGSYAAALTITATLSDGSASPVSSVGALDDEGSGGMAGYITFEYSANSPGQTLAITVVNSTSHSSYSNVTLSAVGVKVTETYVPYQDPVFPNADVDAASWTPSTGSTHYGVLGDSNDSTYSYSGTNSTLKVGLASPADLPVTSADSRVKFKAQGWPTKKLIVSLIEGASTVRGTYTVDPLNPNLTEYSFLTTTDVVDAADLDLHFELANATSPANATVTFGAAGAFAYSAASGTSVSPAYPTSIEAGDLLVLIVGQKPSTANGGTCSTPSGWTAGPTITGAGGYSTTLGADTGNTNLYTFYKVAAGTETGSLSVTVGTNNVAWGQIIRCDGNQGANASWSVAGATGSDTTNGTGVSITMASNPGVTAGDLVIGAMCIPTDVTTPSQFSAHGMTQTGVTFGTATEIGEADSTNGNDIGGYTMYVTANSGTASAAPVMTATAGGTTTNVRGPGVFLRVRTASTIHAVRVSGASYEAAPGDETPEALELSADQTIPAFEQSATLDNSYVPTLWTADALPNDKIWYVGDHTSNTVEGGYLTALYDKGNTGESAPIKSADSNNRAELDNTLNGRTVWESKLTGSNLGRFRAPSVDIASNTSKLVVLAVAKMSVDLGTLYYLDVGDSYYSKATLFEQYYSAAIGGRSAAADGYGDAWGDGSSDGYFADTWTVLTAIYDYAAGTLTLRANGRQIAYNGSWQSPGLSEDVAAAYLAIGYAPDPSDGVTEGINGLTAELIFVKGDLSDDDLYRLEGAASWDWGLEANLDSGHAYYSAPPLWSPDSSLDLQASQAVPAFGQSATLTAKASLTAAQTVPAFGQSAVLSAQAELTAAQTVPAFTQTAVLSAVNELTAAQQVPVFGQSATLAATLELSAAQQVPVFAQSATLTAAVQLTASQAVPAFGQSATLTAINTLEAAQQVPAFTQTLTLESTALGFEANQQVPAFGQSATLETVTEASASQQVPSFGQGATLEAQNALSASQAVPAFSQTATLEAQVSLTANQSVPAFGQTLTLSTTLVLEADQQVPAFPQTATFTASIELQAAHDIPPFGQSATLQAVPILEAEQAVPAFGQSATLVSKTALSATQAVPAFGTQATLEATLVLQASQNVPGFTQTLTLQSSVELQASQSIPAFGQQATLQAYSGGIEAYQQVPEFGQVATLEASVELAANQQVSAFGNAATLETQTSLGAAQAIPAFTQAATLVVQVSLSAAQQVPPFTQTATLQAASGGLEAHQQVPAFGQAATLAATIALSAQQGVPAFGNAATLEAKASITADQTIPVFGQVATLGGASGLQADQQVPVFTQSLTLTAKLSLAATQQVPEFGQTALLELGDLPTTQLSADQLVPPFGNQIVLTARATLTATQVIPEFGQAAYLRYTFQVTIDSRTYHVTRESRTYGVHQEDRLLKALPMDTTYRIIGESRTLDIRPQDRNLQLNEPL